MYFYKNIEARIFFYLKCGCDYSLRCNDCRQNRNDKRRVESSWRNCIEERVRECTFVLTNECCLSNVGQEETWIGISQPAQLNSAPAEGPQVCKQGFDSSEGQEDAPKRSPSTVAISDQVRKSKSGREGFQD